MYDIRPAVKEDLDTIAIIGKAFWDITPYAQAGVPYNKECVQEFLLELLNGHILMVATKEEEIIGYAGFALVPLPFNSNVQVAQEMFWWGHPDHKGVGSKLLGEIEGALKGTVDFIVMGDLASSVNLKKFYEGRGYVMTERSFAKEL